MSEAVPTQQRAGRFALGPPQARLNTVGLVSQSAPVGGGLPASQTHRRVYTSLRGAQRNHFECSLSRFQNFNRMYKDHTMQITG